MATLAWSLPAWFVPAAAAVKTPGLVTPTLGVAGDLLSCGVDLTDAPDTAIGVYRSAAGLEAYVSSGVVTYRCTGPSMGHLTLNPSSPVLSYSGSGFDASYAGISAVVDPTTNPSLRIGYYHAEEHCSPTSPDTANSVGIAISYDSGMTWTARQQLIGSADPQIPCFGFTGVGQPSAIIDGSYVYVFFTDWTPGQANSIGVVRAPLAQATNPASYKKYDSGTWTPALGGAGSPVISRPNPQADVYAAEPQVTYNTSIGEYVAVFETNRGFALAASNNLTSWGPGQVVFWFQQPQNPIVTGNLWQSYPSVLAADVSNPEQTTASNYLYFAQGVRGPGTTHHMVRTWLAFGPPPPPAAVNIPAGGSFSPSPAQSPYAWACSGDVTITGPTGTSVLYDNLADTGVVVALSSGNEATTVTAPWGAKCQATFAQQRDSLVASLVAQMHANGCSTGCARVRVVVLDSAGRTISDQWE